jgi:hypothetical protein
MLSSRERWILTGVWAIIAGSGVLGFLWTRSPAESPKAELPLHVAVPTPRPPRENPVEVELAKWTKAPAPVRTPVSPFVAGLMPEIKWIEKDPPTPKEFLLPKPIYSGRVELDRVTLEWSLRNPTLKNTPDLVQVRSAPEEILIRRRCENGELEQVAVLDAKATVYVDRDVRPNHFYEYWILVRGKEGIERYNNTTVRTVESEGSGRLEARVPAWHKVKLVGGDSSRAILSIDAYNPEKGRWDSSILRVTPGSPIGTTGWTLDRMRFDKSTLVAEVRDDRLERRELSTRND